ncbi:GntR family transcriptional regulator [Thalassobacillus sp. CUG 92003]|uniref:GntR family transcriptional regulator n=1 Tax=Thalassobacillus sp. CUG 92003 TaxID=2736641 RepID=UPI0015E76D4D|nr:GntR family transcriptional regulator [Thalassobacillus sp. CUG 92003]
MAKLNVKPIEKKKTTKEIIYDQLKRAILNGDIEPGETLTETMLAETFQTSRTPIRETVADLTKEGLLVHIPRKGFKIREITESEKEQIMFLRKSIETEGLQKLAPVVTEQQISELKEIIHDQKEVMKEDNRVRYIELDQFFHQKILEFAGQNLLKGIVQELYNLTRLIGHAALMKEGRMQEVIQEHRGVLMALQAGDGEQAFALMQDHLDTTRNTVKAVKKK